MNRNGSSSHYHRTAWWNLNLWTSIRNLIQKKGRKYRENLRWHACITKGSESCGHIIINFLSGEGDSQHLISYSTQQSSLQSSRCWSTYRVFRVNSHHPQQLQIIRIICVHWLTMSISKTFSTFHSQSHQFITLKKFNY